MQKQIHTVMITKRKGAIRRAHRQVQQGRLLSTWAEEELKNDEYYAFLQFCKEVNSSLTETSMISRGTFEFLVEKFNKKEATEY